MYKSDYIEIVRRIPLKVEIYPQNINPTTDRIYEQDCLAFCSEPRTVHEIKTFLGLENINQTHCRFIKPLTAEGKLNFTIPDDPDNVKQMYITARVEMTAEIQTLIRQKLKTKANRELESQVLEYCKEPRMLCEIAEYLGFNHSSCVRKRAVEPLLSEGKLILRYPDWRNYQKQQFMVPGCETPQVTKGNIIGHCKSHGISKR